MSAILEFEQRLSPENRNIFQGFQKPGDIQIYLDSIPYIGEDLDRSPLRVMADRQAHCLDGGLLAALALRRLGYPSLILDLRPDPGMDDDHVLALFKHNNLWGAIAKSNYVGLRFRDPVFRSLRELAMSYFEQFYSVDGVKTLRTYTRPINLDRFDPYGWMWSEEGVQRISKQFYRLKSIPLIPTENVADLTMVDPRSYEAGTLGTNFNWVYRLQ
jgi:hypothetical protein